MILSQRKKKSAISATEWDLLDRTIYVKGNCKVHRAVYDKLNEVLAELQRIENGGTVDDELMANVKLIAGIIDNLYIKSAI